MERGVLAMVCLNLLGCLVSSSGQAQPTAGVDRLYVMECGHGVAPDQGRFSPGYNDGRPAAFADDCYLIRHAKGYFLWGTGIPDRFLTIPAGVPSDGNKPNWVVTRGLAKQLEQIGVKPSEVRYVGIANSHIDHVGNLDMFPAAKVLIQKSELKHWRSQPPSVGDPQDQQLKDSLDFMEIDGDQDVFGDGSMMLIANPSVTPGDQSLLVKLPKTGPILLSGDFIHFQYHWDHRIVPGNVADKEKGAESIKRLSAIVAQYGAQVWIQHDKAQSESRKFAPDFYD
jgi:glyoxylase-like metal-dependent hydrolase (beta-lactamase superfamily II)